MDEEKAERQERSVSAAVTKALHHMGERFGIDPAVLAAGAVAAGVQMSVEDMGPRNCSLWLRDVADMLEKAETPEAVEGVCADLLKRQVN